MQRTVRYVFGTVADSARPSTCRGRKAFTIRPSTPAGRPLRLLAGGAGSRLCQPHRRQLVRGRRSAGHGGDQRPDGRRHEPGSDQHLLCLESGSGWARTFLRRDPGDTREHPPTAAFTFLRRRRSIPQTSPLMPRPRSTRMDPFTQYAWNFGDDGVGSGRRSPTTTRPSEPSRSG